MTWAKHAMLRAERRAFHDYYATPAFVTEALLAVEKFEGRIWEPAAGEGHISRVLEAHGLDVVSTDLIDRGYPDAESGVDFLDTEIECDHVVTNPPYLDGLSLYFAKHALHVARKKVALLLPLTFLESPRKSRFVRDSPLKAVYHFPRQVWTMRRGDHDKRARASKTCFCWFVWQQGWKKKPVIRWLSE